jgi:hypothetical protein
MLSARTIGLLLAAALFAAAMAGEAKAEDAAGGCDLCSAAFNGDIGRVELLLEHGADVNAYSPGGVIAPLGWALANDHFDIALLLVRHGANPNAFVPRQGYAIAYAAEHGDLDVVSALIQAKADVNQYANSASALFWLTQASASPPRNVAVIQMLLEAGADPDGVNNMGRTPLDNLCAYAASTPSSDALALIKTLLVHGAKADDPQAMTEALELGGRGDPSLLMLLLAYGARLEAKDSPRAFEAVRDHPELVAGLIDGGAILDQANAQGDTALNLAVKAGDLGLAEQLLYLGADPNREGPLGTPLSLFLGSTSHDPKMLDALLEHGADFGIVYYEPDGKVSAPLSDAEMSKQFSTLSPELISELDVWFAQRYKALSGMYAYFDPPLVNSYIDNTDNPGEVERSLAGPARGGVAPAEYDGWLHAAGQGTDPTGLSGPGRLPGGYLSTITAQAAFFAASRGLLAPPPVPPLAVQHEAAGAGLYARANSPSGALKAAAEYEVAARLAPWVGAYHRNLCVLYRLGGALARAYEHCVVYASGHPADAAQIEQQMGQIVDRLKSTWPADPN